MSIQPATLRHREGCGCHACDVDDELTAATPNSELGLEQSGRVDPTETTQLQRDLARFVRGRVADLNARLRKRLVEEDALGLDSDSGAWADGPREARLMAFDDWLASAAAVEVTDRLDTQKVRQWFERAAKSGILDGHADLREFGVDTDDVDDVLAQDAVQNQIDERHAALRDRVETAVEDYRSDARRLVSSGIAAGVARRALARDVTERSKVYQSHVTAEAAGEIVNQYNTTQLTSYDRVDEEVELETEVEYVDAGDDKVCERCLELSDQDWSLERAQEEDPLPVHDYCRCRFRVVDTVEIF